MDGMSESVPVRCPACRRAHLFAAPSYPCACGAPVAPPLDRQAPVTAVAHRAWDEEWVTVRCAACDRPAQWPRPELGCPCGAVLRIPMAGSAPAPAAPGPAPAPARPAFQPVTIRTARDAVTTAALYLRWLGHGDVRRADRRPPSGIGLAARGLLAQVDPTVRPASVRDVECLWLTATADSAACVYFSLAGYTDEARARADALGVPLFVLDLTGTPQPVNGHADALAA
ncbi:hypothetical protein ACWC10_07510 [Streptomyces sp. NPDC001595]|uniref:hypothetical protein n=1 Tax=Streptomyces sp. NPDC001532 TaxID=3154520 RepID=UPI0033306B24